VIRLTPLAVVLTMGIGLAPVPSVGQSQVTDVKAFYREGQTFITWKELSDVKGEKYAIYQSDEPITAGNLAGADRLATVAEDSGAFALERRQKILEKKTKVPGYNFRYIIHDNPKADPKAQLDEGVGLFVLTVKSAGSRYYAVVPVIAGAPAAGRLGSAGPVAEKVELPGAVLVWKNAAGTGAVYTHWMDGATWDPLTESNAYNFGVAVPENYNGADPLPVMFYGHGMGGGYRAGDKANYWRCLWVWPGDKSGSWFFGMMNRQKTKVVNYVEQRIRWMHQWIQAERANQFWKVDPRLFSAHGHSMGGTMCNALALRMGDIFCTTVGSAGATIHRRNGAWVRQAAKLWGPVDKNLPTVEGVGVWDHQDYAQWSLAHMEKETAFLLISHGKRDGSVPFEPVPDFLDALQRSKRPFAAYWNQRGHSNHFFSVRNDRMGAYKLALDESLPAFANASNNDDPRTTEVGSINARLEWSAAGNDFDRSSKEDDIADTPEMYAITIRSLSGPATVDVTPRRLQRFKTRAGKDYRWENIDYSDPANPKVIDKGTVKADKHGLVTVTEFRVGKAGWGNRLVIRPAAPQR